MRRAALVACALAIACVPAVAYAAVTSPAARQATSGAGNDRAAGARAEAREVLAQRRFQDNEVTAPLRSLRERIGSALREAGRPFERAYDWVASWLPGGPPVLIALLAGSVLAVAAVIATRAGARRAGGRFGAAGQTGPAGAERLSAARLREQAEQAERRGDLDLALRLRFRAGLVELDRRDIIALRPGLTNHELLRAVPSPTLEGLVDGFEAVAYGGRPAASDDVDEAREGWPRVVEEVRAP
ncbi:MAG: DUF4129 domain-containing protein [Solirubrobacteraceae bacterium]|nr:DUF4129 domain-containing protein [Solirubrobacteraceae bacterium]